MLSKAGRRDIEVEVVFPVASKSISTAEQRTANSASPIQLPGSGIKVLPGPASGEGCSLEGGCAACPFMRINTLAALQVRERQRYGVRAKNININPAGLCQGHFLLIILPSSRRVCQ